MSTSSTILLALGLIGGGLLPGIAMIYWLDTHPLLSWVASALAIVMIGSGATWLTLCAALWVVNA